MNPFDVAIIIILSFCLIRGLFRGLIKELSSIIGVMAGYYAAYTYYKEFSKYLSQWVSNASYLNILSFLILFCGVFIAISLIGSLIKYILNIAYLGWVDRICGAGFGFVKGILIISVLLFILTAFLPKDSEIIKNSLLSSKVIMISETLAKMVPAELKQKFEKKIEDIKKDWKNQGKKTEKS